MLLALFFRTASHFFVPVIFFIFGCLILFIIFKLLIKNKSKTALFVMAMLITTACAVLSGVIYNFIYPTEYPYKDNEIIGENIADIIKIYGTPDHHHEHEGAGFIAYGQESADSMEAKRIMWAHECSAKDVWYYIKYDENKTAYEVKLDFIAGG